MSNRAVLETALLATLVFLLVVAWCIRKDKKLEGFANFTQGIFHSFAAIGIALAGVWVVLQQDWAPRTSVELQVTSHALRGSNPRAALLHIALEMKNEGRVPQRFSNFYFRANAYDPKITRASRDGDLAEVPVSEYANNEDQTIVMPGETDYTYAELDVPCSAALVQLFASVAQPQHLTSDPAEPQRYERKIVVPLDDACSTTSNRQENGQHHALRPPA